MLTNEQKQILNARLDLLFGSISVKEGRPTLVFNNRLRTTAGRAFLETNTVELNPSLDFEFLMADTLPHEYGHLVAFSFFGERGHGPEWRRACKNLGMTEVTRCHSQDVSAKRTIQRRWEYTCQCANPHHVATVTHNKIQAGAHRRCTVCDTRVIWTGKEVK